MRHKVARYVVGLVAALALGAPAAGHAQVVGTGTEGNCFPFGCSGSGASTVYQQVYAASNFSGADILQGISFFFHSGSVLRSGTYDIYFSTTSVAVDALSTSDFDSNRGADNLLFGSFVLGGAAPAVLSFTGADFFYDSALGNLLMDIRVTGGSGGSAFYMSNSGDAGGIYSRSHDFGSSFAGWGLVTEFEFGDAESTVPEPATMTLLATGLAGMAAARRRRKA